MDLKLLVIAAAAVLTGPSASIAAPAAFAQAGNACLLEATIMFQFLKDCSQTIS